MSNPSVRQPNDKEELRHEYTETSSDLRNHANLRFSVFTVYLAAIGGLSSVAFGYLETKYIKAETQQLWGRLGGLLVSLLFFYYELRIQSLINNNLRTLRELELLLNYNHFRGRDSWGKLRSHTATKCFFGIVIAFWMVVTVKIFFLA
jgi:hypothetical protein